MKRLIPQTIVILSLLIAEVAHAQNQTRTWEFAPLGSEWYYERYHRPNLVHEYVSYDKFRTLRIVVINGWPCKEIEMFRPLDCDGTVNPQTEYRYITQEGDRVYEVENGERYLLYDFSKGVGEWWYAPKYGDTIDVFEVSTMQLDDGSSRKVLMAEPRINGDRLYFGSIIEGIGSDQSVFPHGIVWGSPCFEGPIRCYSVNGVPLITSPVECDYATLSVDYHAESPHGTVTIAPSPASTRANVDYTLPDGCAEATLSIVNALGMEVMSVVLEGNQGSREISLERLPQGVYGYIVRCGNKTLDGKFIVVR